jgi:tRNA U38,U39,U40 pseudouridine synthase TruA
MARTQTRIDKGAAILWASAAAIFALAIVQAGRTDPGVAAHAAVATTGDLTVMNFSAGGNEEAVAVLDRREETLFVYSVDSLRNVEMQVAEDIRVLFARARQATSGNR